MDLKDRIREERNKPFNELSEFFLEWRKSPSAILIKTIADDLTKYRVLPKKIILDRDGYQILRRLFELDWDMKRGEETLFNIPVEITHDNLSNYYKLEW